MSQREQKFSVLRFFERLALIVLILGMMGGAFYVFIMPNVLVEETEEVQEVTITPTIRDDMAAHTITIPGNEGDRIMIREIRTSAIVVGGVATFDIMDYIWYEENLAYTDEIMDITLSPYIVADSGKQTPMDTIHYEIEIPLSPIVLGAPDSDYAIVSTTLYNIQFYVREGSTVLINGDDYSDLVTTDGGEVNYNATVQPIGDNVFEIIVRSQYCRENSMTVTLFREKQSIPLDLASDIASSSSAESGAMQITATTLPGAVVNVLTPYSDLDITSTDVDGTFSFYAIFEDYGDNTVTITVDYPGKETTTVNHVVYYVPNIDVYSRKAWDIVSQYTDLVNNNDLRKSQSQIYVIQGTIESIVSTKPQRAYINVGTETDQMLVYVENMSSTDWVEGQYFRLYGDAFGLYDSKPWIVVRYTYDY